MKLVDQVCSLEQAVIFEQTYCLGSTLKPIYCYRVKLGKELSKGNAELVLYCDHWETGLDYCYFPAPTVAELGVLLPTNIDYELDPGFRTCHLNQFKTLEKDQFCIHYFDSARNYTLYAVFNENEAQARAEALIWLLEHDKLEAEDLKL